MATYVLEILDGDRAGETLPVADRTLRIGRKPSNDLVLADEKTSGVHAEVVLEGDRHVLRDLGSTNGTFLDGKRVTEIVLTPGDVVTIGRLRVKFRQEGAASPADAGELAVRRLDATRLQRRSGSTALVGALLVVGLGVGGYLWWQNRGPADDGDATRGAKAPVAIDGNRLDAALASCDSEEGWNLRAAGGAFQPASQRHSGTGAFEAARAEAADAPDFAVLRLTEPRPVLAGRTVTLVAHVQCDGTAQVALRGVCFQAGDAGPFRFRTGTAFAAASGWQRIETVLAVPPGCDRLQIEVVALLPAAGAAARVDDVALLEAGEGAAIEQKLAESSQTLLGTGSAIAIRSVDPDNPATLLSVEPGIVPAELAGLHRAGLTALSDVGAKLSTSVTERSFQLEVSGTTALQLVFPAESAGGLLVDAGDDAGFGAMAADSEFGAARVVLGERSTRTCVRFDGKVTCRGQTGAGVHRLQANTAKVELVLGFRAERVEAAELLRQAKARQQERKPGAALDLVRQLVQKAPFDTEVLAQAQVLRTEILASQGDALRRLHQDLDESTFFDTRGGFERVVQGVDEVLELYGEHNLEESVAAARDLRERAAKRLAELDAANSGVQKQRLEQMAKAFTDARLPGLAELVTEYTQRTFAGPRNATDQK